ncbi:DNA gyrase subunit B [Yersinia phage fHe-Yen9-04]|uniref:DNA topoisomerase (ATP-hydrolyzing) n=2 Tax=Eneladusvirus Yen904 TaxID=2560849 RepID=A0A2C9CXN7_9CAUD|nr:DNA topoisomerase II large subunit [Yersinia phage fHe-Yen9-04]SOK58597.1 DNA gyrase subunit B [Yersinia phage fHe-Yen9-04]SOK59131.1 DNA gyrase subunit B [Yersinia phage fHe-Yen9-03]VUE36366.1 DNA gyrase subunit B [Yersinia phage fHe-Yen9-04]
MAKEKKSSVLAEHGVQQLTEYQHARIRTEMYLGSKSEHEQPVLLFSEDGYTVQNLGWVPALLTSFREIVDNSLDEFVKAGTKDPVLKVSYNENELEFEISDNGRGIPIDYVPETLKHVCTMVLTEMKTGRNFNDDERNNVVGMNGLGGSVVMIVSEKAEIEIHRTGKPYKTDKSNTEYDGMYKFTQKFTEGTQMFPELGIEEPNIRKVKADKTGTTVRFKISKEVFKVHTLPIQLVYSILKEVAAANPTYKIFLNDQRITVNKKGLFSAAKNTMILKVDDNETGLDSTFYIVPNVVEGLSKNLHMQGLVNNAPSLEGGTHLDTFQQKFALGVINALDRVPKNRKRNLKPNRSDIEEGLLIYNITKMNTPTFNSQIKTKLTNENVIKPVQNAMSDDFFNELVKKNTDWIEEIYTRCAERTNKKDADEDRKMAKRLLKGKVAKLRDVNDTKPRSECILLIAEGDSAVSSMTAARNSSIHGILPLRGKIQNVNGREKTKDLMGTADKPSAIHDIMASLNIVPGEKAIRSNMNFGKLYICADEDEDGKNIGALVVNFFYKFWPELFEDTSNPFIYIFKTPFIILEKGKESKYYYGHNVHEYNPDDWKGWKATRAKGLGTLEVSNFRDALANGVAIAITDDGSLAETLDLIFNKDRADDRKEWTKED